MRAVVQRVSEATVAVEGAVVGSIDRGLMVLVGVASTDTAEDAQVLAAKLAGLRIFRDDADKMNLSVSDVGGSVLVISQFTLYGDCRKGRRPSFIQAAPAALAQELYQAFQAEVARLDVPVAHGCFGAHMAVSLVNDGPVTILLESPLHTSAC